MSDIDITPKRSRKVPSSSIGRVRKWFLDNPGEFITYEDVAVKFDLGEIQLRDILKALRREGLIETALMAWTTPGFKP